MTDMEMEPGQGLKLEVIADVDAVMSVSLIQPYNLPENETLYLAPVEHPKGCFEHRIIAPAFYQATCVKSHGYPFKNGKKLCLTWNFFLSGCEELTLPQHMNITDKLKMSSQYAKQWMIANGGRRPSRLSLDRMSARVFLQKSAILYVRFAHPNNPDGSKSHESLRYPVVGHIDRIIDPKGLME